MHTKILSFRYVFQMVVWNFGMKPFIYFSPHDMFHLYTMCEFAYVWFVQ